MLRSSRVIFVASQSQKDKNDNRRLFWELMNARQASFTVRVLPLYRGRKGSHAVAHGTYLLALCEGLFRNAGQEEEVCEGEEDAVVGQGGREVSCVMRGEVEWATQVV